MAIQCVCVLFFHFVIDSIYECKNSLIFKVFVVVNMQKFDDKNSIWACAIRIFVSNYGWIYGISFQKCFEYFFRLFFWWQVFWQRQLQQQQLDKQSIIFDFCLWIIILFEFWFWLLFSFDELVAFFVVVEFDDGKLWRRWRGREEKKIILKLKKNENLWQYW